MEDIVFLIMNLVGNMIDRAFILANDVVLQDWGNQIIGNVAEQTESNVQHQLSTGLD